MYAHHKNLVAGQHVEIFGRFGYVFFPRHVGSLSEFLPKAIQNQFMYCSQTRILLYVVVGQEYSLLFVVVFYVPPSIVFVLTPLRPTAGFLSHFEEGIHVIGKESSSFRFPIALFRFIEMPHFVDVLNYISFLQCLLQFLRDLCSRQ